MRYKLLEDADRGVITDPTPVFIDIKDTFAVCFDNCDDERGGYIASFCGEDNISRRVPIKSGKALIPKELLAAPQRVGVSVCLTDGDEILRAWDCDPLRINTYFELKQSKLQLVAGLTDSELYARIAEMTEAHQAAISQYEALKAEYLSYIDQTTKIVQEATETLTEQGKALASHEKAIGTITESYNRLIEVVNDLSKRLYEVEKNYDPSVI